MTIHSTAMIYLSGMEEFHYLHHCGRLEINFSLALENLYLNQGHFYFPILQGSVLGVRLLLMDFCFIVSLPKQQC